VCPGLAWHFAALGVLLVVRAAVLLLGLVDVRAVAQTKCGVCVICHTICWTEAALSGPYWLSVQGERSSDVVTSLPVGPGLVRA
jgi:hypothetical protein